MNNKYLWMFLCSLVVGVNILFLIIRVYDSPDSSRATTRTQQIRSRTPEIVDGDDPFQYTVEIVFVYIGSSRCAASANNQTMTYVKQARTSIREDAITKGFRFISIGVAYEYDASNGIDHLGKIGGFDEIISGQKHLNSGVMRYIFGDLSGVAATPQILVTLRTVKHGKFSYIIIDEVLLARKIGYESFNSWNKLGNPLPRIPPIRNASRL